MKQMHKKCPHVIYIFSDDLLHQTLALLLATSFRYIIFASQHGHLSQFTPTAGKTHLFFSPQPSSVITFFLHLRYALSAKREDAALTAPTESPFSVSGKHGFPLNTENTLPIASKSRLIQGPYMPIIRRQWCDPVIHS